MKSTVMRYAAVVLIGAGLFLHASNTSADVPKTINYQGHLADANGTPVNDSVDMTFTLHTTPTGNTAIWLENRTVTVVNGLYHVVLGSVTPLDLGFDTLYYLGVTVGTDPEMTPRLPLTSMGYALRSVTANGLEPGSVTSQKIRNGTITPDKIDSFCQIGQIIVRSASGWGCGNLP
jgi:hypothetical protein